MVAENTKKTPQESASVQPATKRATPKKPTTTTPVKQTKPAPPPTKKPSKRKLPQKVRKGKPTFQLVDEDDEAQQESIPQEEGNDPDLELAKNLSATRRAPVGGVTIRDPVSEATPKLHEVVGKGKAVVTKEQVAHSLIDLSKKKRTTDQFILVRRDQTPPDSTTGPSSQPDDDTSEKTSVIDDNQKGHSGFYVFHEKIDDTYNFRDQLLHDKPTEDDQEKSKVREESDSTIPDSSHQTVTSTPPVIAPFTEVLSSKPSLLLRVARNGTRDVEVKKTDLSKYSVLPGPETVKNQESLKKSPREISKPKREHGEEKLDFKLTPSGQLIKLILKN
ncbi:hypothetical protein Tco_0347390 [Tanacetum coccineum]